MSNAAKLKKKAAEFEQKRQFDKALAIYVQILQAAGTTGQEEAEVALFNKVGDLYIRQNNTADALTFYERAVDLYAEGGFHNNAIALCNKILRHAPGRAEVYYKLGKISAEKGFKSDARQNFLEYAERMRRAGQTDEAFRALREFADLCPDQDDIRLMLAEQLSKSDRKPEALEQLQLLYEKYEAEGRGAEQRAALERMRAIDPSVEPRAAGAVAAAKPQSDLVFLDLSWDEGAPGSGAPGASGTSGTPRRDAEPELDAVGASGMAGAPAGRVPLVTPHALDGSAASSVLPAPDANTIAPGFALDGSTDLVETSTAAPETIIGLEPPMGAGAGATLESFGFASLDANTIDAPFGDDALAGAQRDAEPHGHDLVLPGELPSLESMGSALTLQPSAGDTLELVLPDSLDSLDGPTGAGDALPLIHDGGAGEPSGSGVDLPFLDVGGWSPESSASPEPAPAARGPHPRARGWVPAPPHPPPRPG
jgi:hypothetical protein